MPRATGVAAILAAVALAGATLAAADAPPEPGSRVSPYAPQPKQKRNVFGAPIQPAIVGHHKASRSKPATRHPAKPVGPAAARAGKRSTPRPK